MPSAPGRQDVREAESRSPAIIEPSETQEAGHIDYSPPPDGGYGWVVVGCCFTLNCFTWGVTSSYGVYLSHYLSSNLFPEATSLDYGFVGGFNFAFAMLVASPATALTRRLGKYVTMLIGATLQSTGFISASFATRIWHLYITQGALVGAGIGLIFVPSLPILSQWFSRRRGLVNGISGAGSGLGGVAFSWGTHAMIRSIGLSWTLRATGLATLSANTIAALLMRDRNQHIKPHQFAFDISLLRRYEVILLLIWSFVSMFGYITLLFSLSDFSRSIGLSSEDATSIVGILNLGTAIGRPIIGVAGDRFRKIDIAGLLTFFCGIIIFALWIPANGIALTAVLALLTGAILGVFWMTIGPLCVEVGGLKQLQSLLSLSWSTIIIPTTFAEPIALKLRRPGGPNKYLYPQLFAGISYLLAAALMLELRRVMHKIERARHG